MEGGSKLLEEGCKRSFRGEITGSKRAGGGRKKDTNEIGVEVRGKGIRTKLMMYDDGTATSSILSVREN